LVTHVITKTFNESLAPALVQVYSQWEASYHKTTGLRSLKGITHSYRK
jgi:hypothetical protein